MGVYGHPETDDSLQQLSAVLLYEGRMLWATLSQQDKTGSAFMALSTMIEWTSDSVLCW